jgi:hypothetical protein
MLAEHAQAFLTISALKRRDARNSHRHSHLGFMLATVRHLDTILTNIEAGNVGLDSKFSQVCLLIDQSCQARYSIGSSEVFSDL